MLVWFRAVAILLVLCGAGMAAAQTVQSPILTIDSDRLYRGSAFGQRVALEVDTRTRDLSEENRTLEAELEAEEQALTDQRADLAPEDFRALADAFDARVQAIRREREAQSREIAALLDSSRGRFLQAAAPILEDIMREAGAGVVLEVRGVFISANAIDITDRAITRIDAAIGDGGPDPD